MRAIAYEAWALRLGQLLFVEFTLLALTAWRLFLPSLSLIVALILSALSLTFAMASPLVLGLGKVISK